MKRFDGEDGRDGDSFFNSITQDDDYVYFTLADGTTITVPKSKKDANSKIYYTSSDGSTAQINWYMYSSYIEPYNF